MGVARGVPAGANNCGEPQVGLLGVDGRAQGLCSFGRRGGVGWKGRGCHRSCTAGHRRGNQAGRVQLFRMQYQGGARGGAPLEQGGRSLQTDHGSELSRPEGVTTEQQRTRITAGACS
jgi:hypothetical protein